MQSLSHAKLTDSFPFLWVIVITTAVILAAFAWRDHETANSAWGWLAAVALVLGYATVRRRGTRPRFRFFRRFVMTFLVGQFAIVAISPLLQGQVSVFFLLTLGVALTVTVVMWRVLRFVERATFCPPTPFID